MAIAFPKKQTYGVDDLLEIMRLLRSPDGCPWDREQNHRSIRSNLLEEAHEAIEAIDRQDIDGMREEFGDVLLQVVFHARIAEENGTFTFSDITDELCRKLLVRHPHVFGDANADTTGDALKNWDAAKRQTKGTKKQTKLLDGVPHSLPALMRTSKVMSRAARVGLDVAADTDILITSVKDRLDRLQRAPENADTLIGDMLFATVALSRALHVDAEEATALAANRFIDRFAVAEKQLLDDGNDIADVTASQWAAALGDIL